MKNKNNLYSASHTKISGEGFFANNSVIIVYATMKLDQNLQDFGTL